MEMKLLLLRDVSGDYGLPNWMDKRYANLDSVSGR
jgi:hypothetical protein